MAVSRNYRLCPVREGIRKEITMNTIPTPIGTRAYSSKKPEIGKIMKDVGISLGIDADSDWKG